MKQSDQILRNMCLINQTRTLVQYQKVRSIIRKMIALFQRPARLIISTPSSALSIPQTYVGARVKFAPMIASSIHLTAILFSPAIHLYGTNVYLSHPFRALWTKASKSAEVVALRGTLPAPVGDGNRSAWTEILGENVEFMRERSPFHMFK